MLDNRERWIFGLTAASASAVLLSIAASQILLTLALVVWLLSGRRKFVWPGYSIALLAFFATTLLSLLMSPEPHVGMGSIRKFVLFAMGFLAVNFVTNAARARGAHVALLSVATFTSLFGIVQFAINYSRFAATQALADDPTVLARITGFMGHWMTYSGEQLLVWSAAVPALATLGRKWFGPVAIIGAAIVLSFTRSVWLGAVAGVAVVAMMVPRKVLVGVLLPVALVAVAVSGLIYHRVAMSMVRTFAPDSGRMEMVITGTKMIKEHPLFGVGPERIAREFPRYYRGQTGLDSFYYGHLHNNVMQIAAERGLLCLAAFLWLVFELYSDMFSMLKLSNEQTRWSVLSALASLTAFIVAGFFEYNFGDSEVLLLLLFIVSLPYGLAVPSHRNHESPAAIYPGVGPQGLPV